MCYDTIIKERTQTKVCNEAEDRAVLNLLSTELMGKTERNTGEERESPLLWREQTLGKFLP